MVMNRLSDVSNSFGAAVVKRDKGEFVCVMNCDKPTAKDALSLWLKISCDESNPRMRASISADSKLDEQSSIRWSMFQKIKKNQMQQKIISISIVLIFKVKN